jgi:hypothetical protein
VRILVLARILFVVALLAVGAMLFSEYRLKAQPSQKFVGSPPAEEVCDFTDSLKFHSYEETDIWWKRNNKFGIYTYAENKDFIELAQKLVNSNGGSWGYVLIPYNVKDFDREKWSRVFSQLISKELIPVIQLWDIDPDDYKEQTKDAARFLNSFVWPIRYKYVAVYNEPNDASFWKGKVDPKEYADVLLYTIETFKQENPDFYLMNAGFNTSARTDTTTMDAFAYMRAMNEAQPGIFEKLDAWSSHSYPQPNFSGNPHVTGRWSIRAYETELDFLHKSLGLQKDLPVFITETGWAHAEGEVYNSSYLSVETVANHFKTAYTEFWLKDDRVRAVMPFTIWYNPPYDHFSWVNKDKVPYKHFEEIKQLKKVSGLPPKLNVGQLDLRKCTSNAEVKNN